MDAQLIMISRGLNPPLLDLSLDGYDLAAEHGLQTAVLLSLFTDRRADAHDVLPDGGDDRRGWWADAVADVPDDQHGSLLWLLRREKLLPGVAERARQYAEDALAWCIEDGIAAAVQVDVSLQRPDRLLLHIVIERLAGGRYEQTFNMSLTGSGGA